MQTEAGRFAQEAPDTYNAQVPVRTAAISCVDEAGIQLTKMQFRKWQIYGSHPGSPSNSTWNPFTLQISYNFLKPSNSCLLWRGYLARGLTASTYQE